MAVSYFIIALNKRAKMDLYCSPDYQTFQVNWSSGSREEVQYRFSKCSHGDHLGFPIKRLLAIFDLQVTLILPMKF